MKEFINSTEDFTPEKRELYKTLIKKIKLRIKQKQLTKWKRPLLASSTRLHSIIFGLLIIFIANYFLLLNSISNFYSFN